jgi:glucose-6-phosphate 1-epimerase
MPAALTPGNNGLEKVVLSSPHGTAEIYRLGATITRLAIKGKEIIFVSAKSPWQVGKAIRGGVPICWPWFGPHPTDAKLPQHGPVRAREWTLAESGEHHATLSLTSSAETLAIWPQAFEVTLRVTLIPNGLTFALTSKNTGTTPFTFGDALHTYFNIGDIHKTTVSGLKGLKYVDKVDGLKVKEEAAEKLALTGTTDRVYIGAKGPHVIESPSARITVSKSGSADTVVWNPWDTLAEKMPDLSGNQWPGFICVEAVNTAEHLIPLAPGQSQVTSCTVEVA